MGKKVLVTGGAGFIGSHLVEALLEEGNEVVVLDNLSEQVHGKNSKGPGYLDKGAEFIKGDVRNEKDLAKAIDGAEVVFHEAAAVGVGQSMYEVNEYIDNNDLGTAKLLEHLIKKEHSVKKLLVASSMSAYGEGLYFCGKCKMEREPGLREEKEMQKGNWEQSCPECGSELKAVATPERKKLDINSIYALTKRNQEEIVLMLGKAYGIPAVALRYFNVLGPRQSLSNPYTGVAAIFLSRVKNKKQPIVYEDGLQSRDFVSVHDIVNANLLAMKSNAADYEPFNVGTGKPSTIKELAETICSAYNFREGPIYTQKFRKGDIRHCYADISKIRKKLGFEPGFSLEKTIAELIEWSKKEKAIDKFDEANSELKKFGLV
ncbi:MAG: SDR family NAD(P)-dependent oxidoreductase [Candidatus Diapherotrites archaeon]